jgi:DNA-binding XRE family transcriptional regulator
MSLKNIHIIGKAKREEKNLSRKDVANISGVNYETICHIEEGKNTTMNNLSRYLGAIDLILKVVNK